MDIQYYYNNEKEITYQEAHDLKDKSGLVVSGEKQEFKKKETPKKKEKKKNVR